MTVETEEQYKLKIEELQKEIAALKAKQTKRMKGERYGLCWIDVPEAFDADSRDKIPVLEELKDKAIKSDDGKPTHILIEGDNYHALTCLNYTHAGKIDVIYIDPPYNTGSDGFVYRDARFLEQFPDGTTIPREHPLRHSTWLSFMSKRLKLAKKLLSDRGVIFISIDDNEQANLKLLCDEVFGEGNFITSIIIRANSRGQTYNQIAKTHEYLLCYSRSNNSELFELEKEAELSDLNLTDNIGAFNIRELRNRNPKFGKHNRPFLFYPIYVNPKIVDKDGFSPVSLTSSGDYSVEVLPYNSEGKESCWRWGSPKSSENIKEDTLSCNLVAKIKTTGSYGIFEKYRKTTYKPKSIWDENSFLTETGTVEMRQLGFASEFDFPKPIELIKRCICLSAPKSSTVLDFFAGSGTTLHAVMKLNAEDGGKRQCILVQQKETEANICQTITYERNRRVMQGYTNSKGEAVAGLGNSLKYYRTDFVGKHSARLASDEDRILLARKAGCLISLSEDTLEELKTTSFYSLYTDAESSRLTAIYFDEDPEQFPEFVTEVGKFGKKTAVYVYTEGSAEMYGNEFEDLSGIEIKAIPRPILEIYKTLNGGL